MKFRNKIRLLFFILGVLCICNKTFSQCFEIESILVAACTPPGPNSEGFNEMVRFRVGSAGLNTSTMTVSWPNNPWQGLIQNATTAAKVAILNAQVAAVNGCGQVLEPVGGILPANAEVLLVSSYNFSAVSNDFGALTENLYILFQDNATTTIGHFANYNTAPGFRTLTILFGACADSVTYDRTQLSNGSGASVNYDATGNPTYMNMGCVAPVQAFTVDAGSPLSACPGTTISLLGTAVGYTTLGWTASEGSFSAPASLNSNYTLSPTASGSVTLTLSAADNCGHTITDTMILTVTAAIVPTFTQVAPICEGDALSPLPTTSLNGITGSWSPPLNNLGTTSYIFTPTAGQCATTAPMVITVIPKVIPVFNPVGPICSGTAVTPLPATSLNGITGVWSPALSNTVPGNYIFTPNPGQGQCIQTAQMAIAITAVSIIPTFTQVAPICEGDALSPLPTTSLNGITGSWSPPLNNLGTTSYIFTPTVGQCATTAPMVITVIPKVIPVFNPVGPICSGTAVAPLPATSLNGITGVWSPALSNTVPGNYIFTPNPGQGQCIQTAQMAIAITAVSIVPTFTQVAPICEGDALLPLPTTSLNGITGSWSPPLNNLGTTPYVFTPTAGQCATTAPMTITVIPKVIPTFASLPAVCVGSTVASLPTTSLNGITGSWSPPINNTLTTQYTFTPNAGQCAKITYLTIPIAQPLVPVLDPTIPTGICLGASLTPLPLTSINGITGSWAPALNNTQTTTYRFTPDPGQCATYNDLTINVIAPITKTQKYSVCVDQNGIALLPAKIDTGLSALQYTFVWELGGNPISNTAAFYDTTIAGNYTVTATHIATGCTALIFTAQVDVLAPGNAVATVSEDFADVAQIKVSISMPGNYEYQLNGGAYQASNIFTVNEGGDYKIHVRENPDCHEFDLQVSVLIYPRFFTPNGDGYNDFWNINGLPDGQVARIHIFDRYGKLLKQMMTEGAGWDGTYNERELPATDYWFVLFYKDKNKISKQLKSHFSLKR